jgi:hypothetical protein
VIFLRNCQAFSTGVDGPGFAAISENTAMKHLILTAAISLLSLGIFAQNPTNNHDDKYCAKMKDGKMVVMHNGNAITADVRLDNGATVKPDGTVLWKDGTNQILSDGECIYQDGSSSMKKNKSYEKKS